MNRIHACECAACRAGQSHAGAAQHRMMNVLLSRLNEAQRRWFAAYAALQLGYGGVTLMAEISGMDRKTIRRGIRELQSGLADQPERGMRAVRRSRTFLTGEEVGLR